jgi:hypothetical protein
MCLRFNTVEMFKETKEKAIIDRYYDLLVNKRPKFKTDSSYERFFYIKFLINSQRIITKFGVKERKNILNHHPIFVKNINVN